MTRMAKGIRARLVLELLAKGMTGRETRPARHISQRGTGLAGEASERAGVTLGDVAGMPDREACDLLFPAQKEAREAYAEPGWEWVRPEPQGDGVTPGPLWEEHRDGAIRDGLAPEGHDTLRGGHRSYAGARGVTNHPGHKPGQVMEVDRDGTPMCEARRRGGRGHQVPLARGDPTLLAARLRRGHAGHAAEHVARVPRARLGLLRRRGGGDRLRQSRDRRGLPPQGRRGGPRRGPRGSGHPPRDGHHAHGRAQAQAEGRRRGHVRKGRHIHRGEAAQPRLPHARGARRRDARGTRRPRPCPLPEASGGAFLAPLPKMPSGVRWWACGRKVAPDPHVTSGRDHHPVPHACVGQRADLRAGDPAVEVWIAGGRVATHPRLGPHVRWPCRTGPPHMPPELAHAEWDDARMPRRSREAGPNTHAVASRVLADARMRGQGHDPALAVPDPSRRYGEEAQCH